MCIVRSESVSAIYLADATNAGVTNLDRLESWLWPQLTEGVQQDLIQFQQKRGAVTLYVLRVKKRCIRNAFWSTDCVVLTQPLNETCMAYQIWTAFIAYLPTCKRAHGDCVSITVRYNIAAASTQIALLSS